MRDEELKRIVQQALDQSITVSSDLESDQGDALDYYHGKPYGNETEGRSQVVTREVLQTIEWIMPSLMRVFASGSKTVQFDPVEAGDEKAAELETKVVNHVFNKDNEGFEIIHNWFKDALLQKVGYVKAYWEDEEEVKTERYTGLTDERLAELLSDPDVQAVAHEVIEEPVLDEMGQQSFIALHDVEVKRTEKHGDLKIINIPQEEMRVSRNATSVCLDDVDFAAHVTTKTASDLIEMGYEKSLIDQLGDDEDQGDLDYKRNSYGEENDDEVDESMKLITVEECYIKTDYNKDGVAELRRVLKSGSHILENDEWDVIPFAALTPLIMPHKHVGLSEADMVMDIQKIKSTLVRQMLDNLYLTNNPEKEVLDSKVNMDDLLKSVAGGVKRVKQMGSIREIAVPFTAGSSLPMLEVLDGMAEARTGVSRHTMGLDADTLAQSTKGAYQTGLRQANQRVEMLARTFAETGVKSLFRKIHSLLIKHQDKARDLNIDKEWVSINPSEWRDRKSMSVVVGIGTGDKSESLMNLQVMAQNQEQHLLQGSPLVSLKNLYNTYEKMVELAELKDPSLYYTDPDTIPPKQEEPPQPSPEELLAKAQIDLAYLQAENQKSKNALEQQKLALQMEVEKEKARDMQRGVVADQQNIALKAQETSKKSELEKTKLATEIQLRARELELKEKELEMDHDKQIQDWQLKMSEKMTPIIESISTIQQQISAPKRIERDAQGNLISINGQSVSRDDQGNITGIG